MNLLPSRSRVFLILLAIIAGIIVYASTWNIPAGYRGVEVRFGAIRPDLILPGIHLGSPWPLGEVRMIPVEQTRQILLESITDERLGSQKNEYLTGDENLLNIALRVDYRVGDPLEIARTGLSLIDEQLLKLAESSLVTVLTNASVNDLLGPRRGAIDQQFREHLQRESDQLSLGIRITGANWSEVAPLKEVQESFESAQSAVNEAAGRVAKARTQAESDRIQTTSEVAKIKAEAETNASLTKSMAESESRRFKGILKQAQRTGFMQTAKTLWLDTVSEILPALKSRTVLATDQPTDLTIIRSAIPPEAKVSP